MTRFCVKCEYSYHGSIIPLNEYKKCNRPEIASNNKVTGIGNMYCSVARSFKHLCGENGRYFEPRKTIWQKLKGFFK